uniref:Uncharacterized protein n=1 Tax=Marmota marmota marmota TaxID=9994 RepID=A0A8C6ENY0_MARMA
METFPTCSLLPGRSPLAPQIFLKGLLQGVVYGSMAVTLLFLCLLPFIVKHIRKKNAKKTAKIKAQKNPEVSRPEPKMSPKNAEPGKSITTPSSENQILVGTHYVWNPVYQDKIIKTQRQPGAVAHTCILSNSGGRGRRISRPA